jgi:hypothetical protein
MDALPTRRRALRGRTRENGPQSNELHVFMKSKTRKKPEKCVSTKQKKASSKITDKPTRSSRTWKLPDSAQYYISIRKEESTQVSN